MRKILCLAATLALAMSGPAMAQINPSITITAVPVIVTPPPPPPPGGGACAGGDSGFVPAGYKCVESSTDEFNGTSIDTSKWQLTGGDGTGQNGTGQYEANGVVHCDMSKAADGGNSSCGMHSLFPIPDAPMYLEFRRRLVETALYQFWINTCFNVSSCTGEETDVDMGYQEGGQTFLGSSLFTWDSGASTPYDFGYGCCFSPLNMGDWFTIGFQRDPNPAPNGTLRFFVNGTLVRTFTDMPDNRFIYPSKFPNHSSQDIFQLDYFCTQPGGKQCPNDGYIDWDYIRVYTPSGLPNGY